MKHRDRTNLRESKAKPVIFIYNLASVPNVEMNHKGEDEASHLCHIKSCFNPEHIVLESREMNKQRDACVAGKKCRGHGSAADCIV